MNKYITALLISLASVSVEAGQKDPAFLEALWHGAEAKIELHVADDGGTPVESAKVKAYLGMNFRPKGKWVDGTTDANGVFVIEGSTCGDEIEVFVTKSGYYDSRVNYCYAAMGAEHEVKDGKWQPYGGEERIVLRRIINPVSLLSKGGSFDIPVTNKWISFDVFKMDWGRPYGGGDVNDLELMFEWDGLYQNMSEFQRLRLKFPNCADGAYVLPTEDYSSFRYAYSAQTNACYGKEFDYSMRREGGKYMANKLDDSSEMVWRLRTTTNEHGKVVSCHYGQFRGLDFGGGVAKGEFYLYRDMNPKPNDTNLEPKGDDHFDDED